MKHHPDLRRLFSALTPPIVHLTIFLVGLRYAYYQTFSLFRPWDDEGTMMLQVAELVKDPHSSSALAGIYGPLYYVHKYVIYALLGTDVSHDINRLTTIVFWNLVALLCAVFVYRLSRSTVLAALVQMQLVLHLHAFASEPGHPHEIGLALIAGALVLSSFTSNQRRGLAAMVGLGAATGALLLVKVNLGVYMGAALTGAILLSLPRSTLARVLAWSAAAGAVLMPAAVMLRHLHLPWARHYCILATSLIISSLAVSARSTVSGETRWAHVGAAAGGATLVVLGMVGVLLGWGQSVVGVANAVFLRAASFPSVFVIPAPLTTTVAQASAVSLLMALCYSLVAQRLAGSSRANLALAVVKLAYGCLAFYSLHQLGPGLLRQTIPVPFMWLVLVRPDTECARRESFPRAFLCLLAAFQTLQAYPVHGSQATWAVFLVAPLAAVCISDALHAILEMAMRSPQDTMVRSVPKWLPTGIGLVMLVCACSFYYDEADTGRMASVYQQRASLGLPGASRLRLTPDETASLRWLVTQLRAKCDGFIGMPGFASLYFWSRIPPPGAISNAWLLTMTSERQEAVIARLEADEHPCVVRNSSLVGFWTGGKPPPSTAPLVAYINSRYKPVDKFGGYELLTRATEPGRTEAER